MGDDLQLKKKGRGHKDMSDMAQRYGKAKFSELKGNTGAGPTPSVEGWVIIVTGVHEEAQVRVLMSAMLTAVTGRAGPP